MKTGGKEKLVIIGSSGHAKVIIDMVERQGRFHLLGLIDDFRDVGVKTCGYSVLGGVKDVGELRKSEGDLNFIVGIGANWIRKLIVNQLIEQQVPIDRFISVIHPSANISNFVTIGVGVVVMAGSTVNSDTKIGDFAIINSNSSVDHDCNIGDYASVAPNAVLGGAVTVGSLSAVSIGATVINNVNIGSNTVIGAGAVVLKDCGNFEVLYGVPAKFIRNRKINEPYL